MKCRTDDSLKIWDWLTNNHKQVDETGNKRLLTRRGTDFNYPNRRR